MTINTLNSQIYSKIPREDSVITLLNGYLDLSFEDIRKKGNSRLGNGKDIRLVNLGPIALFSKYKLTTSSGKHLEDINHAHLASSRYKLLASSRGSDDLSVGLDRDRGKPKRRYG